MQKITFAQQTAYVTNWKVSYEIAANQPYFYLFLDRTLEHFYRISPIKPGDIVFLREGPRRWPFTFKYETTAQRQDGKYERCLLLENWVVARRLDPPLNLKQLEFSWASS